MMESFRWTLQRFSLRVQTVVIMSVIGTAVGGFITYLNYRQDLHEIDKQIEKSSHVQTELIRRLSLDALLGEDRPALQTTIEGLRGMNIGLHCIEIANYDGDVLASWQSDRSPDGSIREIRKSILYRDQPFGTLFLRWDDAYFAQPLHAKARSLSLLLFISITVLVASFVAFVEVYFVRPVNHLERKVDAFSERRSPRLESQEFCAGEMMRLDRSLDEAIALVRKQAENEKELREQKARARTAEAAAEARAEFLSLMSHEIRTPLGAILGFAQLLDSSRLDHDQKKQVWQIRESGSFLLTILNDILDLSKIEANGIELAQEPFRLGRVMEDLESMMSNLADTKGLKFVTKAEFDSDATLIGDTHRLKQVLMNLLGNAVKFTEKGTVTASVTGQCVDQCGERFARVRFSVKDTGIGMTAEQAERIFEPFSQADASITRRFGGTGLGVSISRKLIDLMGGELWVESEIGEGSEFGFVLDFPIAEAGNEIRETGRELVSPADSTENVFNRLLVAEDDPVNRTLLDKILRRMGQEIVFAENGEECLSILASEGNFDAILLDLRMPKLGGMEVMCRLRAGDYGEELQKIPIAILSADVLAREQAISEGADDFLMKPIEFDYLLRFLSRTCKERTRLMPEPVSIESAKMPTRNRENGAPRPHVLVAEDSPAIRSLIEKILRGWGYDVDCVEDGEDCLRQLEKRHYDVVLSDLRMPRMDGRTLIGKIRQGDAGEGIRSIAIALMTAEQMSEEEVLEIRADAFIPKPIPMDILKSFLEGVERGAAEVALSS